MNISFHIMSSSLSVIVLSFNTKTVILIEMMSAVLSELQLTVVEIRTLLNVVVQLLVLLFLLF
jgi:hypothetical protein